MIEQKTLKYMNFSNLNGSLCPADPRSVGSPEERAKAVAYFAACDKAYAEREARRKEQAWEARKQALLAPRSTPFNFYDDVWEPIFGDGEAIGKVLGCIIMAPIMLVLCVIGFIVLGPIVPFIFAPFAVPLGTLLCFFFLSRQIARK